MRQDKGVTDIRKKSMEGQKTDAKMVNEGEKKKNRYKKKWTREEI